MLRASFFFAAGALTWAFLRDFLACLASFFAFLATLLAFLAFFLATTLAAPCLPLTAFLAALALAAS